MTRYDDDQEWGAEVEEGDYDENYEEEIDVSNFPVRVSVSREEVTDAVRLFAWELSLIKEKELYNTFLSGKPSYGDVKRAYRLLAKANHPDRPDIEENDQIKKINIAFEILSSTILPDGSEKEIEDSLIKRPSKMEHPDVRAIVAGIKDYFRSISEGHPNIKKDFVTLNSHFGYSNLINYYGSKEENRVEFRGDELYNIVKAIYYAFDAKSYDVGYGKNKTKIYPHYKLWYLINLVMEKSEDEKREGLGGFDVKDVINSVVRLVRDHQLILVDEREHQSKMHLRKRENIPAAVKRNEVRKRHMFRKGIIG
jgi:curved DNA-binding protein CbpA